MMKSRKESKWWAVLFYCGLVFFNLVFVIGYFGFAFKPSLFTFLMFMAGGFMSNYILTITGIMILIKINKRL